MSVEFEVMTVETLSFLMDITKMLNAAPTIPTYSLHVELRRDDGEVVGVWTDEIGDKDWMFALRDFEEPA